jgi:hypothetical protein
MRVGEDVVLHDEFPISIRPREHIVVESPCADSFATYRQSAQDKTIAFGTRVEGNVKTAKVEIKRTLSVSIEGTNTKECAAKFLMFIWDPETS